MAEDKDRLSTIAGGAGGAALTAGYYKAARDNEIARDYMAARRRKRNNLGKKIQGDHVDPNTGKKITAASRKKRKMDKWETKQAKKHGVFPGKTTKGKDLRAVRGKLKKGKFKPSALSAFLTRGVPGFNRAKLPRSILYKLPKFK